MAFLTFCSIQERPTKATTLNTQIFCNRFTRSIAQNKWKLGYSFLTLFRMVALPHSATAAEVTTRAARDKAAEKIEPSRAARMTK